MSHELALGKCDDCGLVVYLTKAGRLRAHLPDGRQNDGGVVPPEPRCPGGGKGPKEILR